MVEHQTAEIKKSRSKSGKSGDGKKLVQLYPMEKRWETLRALETREAYKDRQHQSV